MNDHFEDSGEKIEFLQTYYVNTEELVMSPILPGIHCKEKFFWLHGCRKLHMKL